MTKAEHHMYFIAVICPGATGEKIQQAKRWMRDHFGSSHALKSPAHITLVPPFWFASIREPELLDSFQQFRSPVNELEISLDGFGHFDKRVLYVVVKDNSGLHLLQQAILEHAMTYFGDHIKKEDRSFHPHITIATRDIKPGDFDKAWEHFAGKKMDETFQARTISLLRLDAGSWKEIATRMPDRG
jgi:2'-5' RNA ligase